jgi:hypothetical protein
MPIALLWRGRPPTPRTAIDLERRVAWCPEEFSIFKSEIRLRADALKPIALAFLTGWKAVSTFRSMGFPIDPCRRWRFCLNDDLKKIPAKELAKAAPISERDSGDQEWASPAIGQNVKSTFASGEAIKGIKGKRR